MMDYSKIVMDNFQNPEHAGAIKGANGIGKVGNARCGDIMKIYLKINDKLQIEDASFKTFGCAAAIASTNMAIEMIKGKTIEEALKLKNSDVVEALGGLPAVKIHCSILAEEAIHAAVDDYYKRKDKKEKADAEDDDSVDADDDTKFV